MQTVSEALEQGTALLKSLSGSTLTADQIDKIIRGLSETDITDILKKHPLAGASEEDDTDQNKFQSAANEINKQADRFNDELERIKRLRQTLNQEALDPLIDAARKLIHPVYRFTSGLQGG